MGRTLNIFYNSLGTPEMYAIIAERLRPGMRLITLETDSDEERAAKIADCEVAIVAARPLTKQIISAAQRLEIVHHQGVGYHDTVDTGALSQRGLRLAITPQGTSVGVAEHAVLLALAAARRAAFADAELRAGRWLVNALRPVSVELFGKTVGFIGFGRIGQEAAIRFASFGTTNVYFDPAVEQDETLPAAARPFDWIIANADFISLHLPLTGATRQLMSREVIARMKPDAILINTARGGIVDDFALAEALASGRLLAAGLDVFEAEPLPANHPLCDLPNVVLTPHISAGTRDALGHKMDAVFSNLDRYRRGGALLNEVDLASVAV